jgi:hypothetical protein
VKQNSYFHDSTGPGDPARPQLEQPKKKGGKNSPPNLEKFDGLNAGSATHQVTDQRNQENHQENEEQDFCDSGSRERNSSETQDASDDGNHQSDQRVIKHISSYGRRCEAS